MNKKYIKRINEAARRLENAGFAEDSAWYKKLKKFWQEAETNDLFTKGKKPRLSTQADEKRLIELMNELDKNRGSRNVGQVRKSFKKGFETFKNNKAALQEARRRGIEITEDVYRKAKKAMANLTEDEKDKFGSDIFIIATSDLVEGIISDMELNDIFQRIGEMNKFEDEISDYLGEYGSIKNLIEDMEEW